MANTELWSDEDVYRRRPRDFHDVQGILHSEGVVGLGNGHGLLNREVVDVIPMDRVSTILQIENFSCQPSTHPLEMILRTSLSSTTHLTIPVIRVTP